MNVPATRRTVVGSFACVLLLVASISTTEARWKPEYAKNPPEVTEWFQKVATINPRAYERISSEIQQMPDFSVLDRPLTETDKMWMNKAQTTPEAADRLKVVMCCDHGDRVKTKFFVDRTSGHDRWKYQDPTTGVWKDIPEDIVHYGDDNPQVPPMPKLLRQEGVLFVYNGKELCFWPPEDSK